MVLPLAVNLHRLILDVGAYAGFASVIGLAVLSALYFSQARDVKRLREWAGRAPERTVEQQIGGRPATQAAQAQAAAQAAARAATPTPASPAQTPQTPAAAQQGAAAPATGGGGTATAAPPRPAAPPVPPGTMPSAAPGQTAILSQPAGGAVPPQPWYRRIQWPEPRYIALIVAAVLVVGAGAAYGISKLTSSSSSGTSTPQGQSPVGGGGTSQTPKPAKVDPSKVTVAVLNGTRIPGLAAQVGDRVQSAGFQKGNVATAQEAQKAESVVEFKPGANRAARLLARKLHISQIEPLDPSSGDQTLAGDAQVLVIVGADQQRNSGGGGGAGATSTGAGGTGTPGTSGGTATSP